MTALTAFAVAGFEIPSDLVVLGVITGLTYGLLGVGLSLAYRASGVLNFAHGEIGALPAVLMAVLVINEGWSYWAALPLALVTAAALGGLVELLVLRRLVRSPRLVAMVATIGVAQVLLVINVLIPREGRLAGSRFPTPFSWSFTVGGYVVSPGEILILLVAPAAVVGLTLFLQRGRLGIASRAAAENRDAAASAGIPVGRVTLLIWVLAGLLAGVSAILVAPTQPLLTRVALGPSLTVRALAAVMLGGLTRLPAVFLSGVGIGLVEALVVFNYPTGGTLELLLFVIIAGSLAWRTDLGATIRGGEERSWSLTGAVRRLPHSVASRPVVRRARWGILGAVLLLAIVAPVPMSSGQRVFACSVLLFALMGLSLVVLTGYAGQVSLGQFAFVALGAVVGGRLLQLGYPGWSAFVYSTVAGGVAALVIGVPALRLRGLFLAVTTLAFSLATTAWLFGQSWLVTSVGNRSSLTIPRPVIFGADLQDTRNYYWLCLAVLVAVAASVGYLPRTGLGRSMLAVRDNEPSAAALSVPPRRVKLLAFVLAGGIASMAGYLYGGLLVTFNSGTFGVAQSFNLLAMVVFGGVTTVTGAVLGAVWVQGIPYFFGTNAGLLSSGIGLLVVLLAIPGGLASIVFRARDRLLSRHRTWGMEVVAGATTSPPGMRELGPTPSEDGDRAPGATLEARGIEVSFGGVRALDGVSLTVSPGEIVGLVGPNGAGKTTLFDVLSGQLRPDTGVVLLDGEDITTLRPEERAARGVGRTFQQARLFPALTVRETLMLGRERAEPSEVVPSLLALPPSVAAERTKLAAVDELIELLGLSEHADRPVGELSTGMRRLVELGAVLALDARVVLLDEPMAGVAQREVEAFGPLLRQVRAHLGAGMVVIDHDIPMVRDLSDRVCVLSAGAVLADGDPSLLETDPAVAAAYLGTDERAVRRSGRLAGSAPA